ncbi:MAG: Hsp20 family protein [Bacilli bacterium]|nr:Hsp20 family protein [Bacilli bacterium]
MMLPDRFFDDMFLDTPRASKERMDCDIYEEDGKYVVEASVYGFDKNDIKIETEDGSIIITAEKNEDEVDNSNKKYLRRERHSSSSIQRAFYLGDIDESSIKASFNNGVLKIEASKKEVESNRKQIDID